MAVRLALLDVLMEQTIILFSQDHIYIYLYDFFKTNTNKNTGKISKWIDSES